MNTKPIFISGLKTDIVTSRSITETRPVQLQTAFSRAILLNIFQAYDPHTGRHIQSDPIGLDGGSYSTYSYADDDAVNLSDALGLMSNNGGYRVLYKNASPVLPSTEAQVVCMMNKLGVQLIITGGTEPGHLSADKGGKHPIGQAVDYGANNNPTITPSRGMEGAVNQAACDCNFNYGGWEPNFIKQAAKHYHYQNGAGPSNVPKINCKNDSGCAK